MVPVTAEERCECCDLPVSGCGKAAEDRMRALAREELAGVERQGRLLAKYPGSCGDCGERIEPGDVIHEARCGEGWRGECCP